jgi:hypothetical protein
VRTALTTDVGRRILQAVSTFGAYLVDDAAGKGLGDVNINYEVGVAAEVLDLYGIQMLPSTQPNRTPPLPGERELYGDLAAIFQALHAVINNSPKSIGGGGRPLVPPPPDLCAPPAGPIAPRLKTTESDSDVDAETTESDSDVDAAASQPAPHPCVIDGAAMLSCFGFNATDSTDILQAALHMESIRRLTVDLPSSGHPAWLVRPLYITRHNLELILVFVGKFRHFNRRMTEGMTPVLPFQ